MAESQAPANKPIYVKKEVKTDLNVSGVLLFKGALTSVLGARAGVTSAVEYSAKTKAVLSILLKEGEISQEDLLRIQEVANSKIAANVPIVTSRLPRAEAESKYAEVNGVALYDETPIAADATEVDVALIDGFSVCAYEGPFVATTADIKSFYIQKMKRRAKRNVYEIQFVVEAAAIEAFKKKAEEEEKKIKPAQIKEKEKEKAQKNTEKKESKSAKTTTPTPTTATPSVPLVSKKSAVQNLTKEVLMELLLPTLAQLKAQDKIGGKESLVVEQAEVELAGGKKSKKKVAAPVYKLNDQESSAIIEALSDRLELTLQIFQDQAYTKGFKAASDVKERRQPYF